MTKDQIKILSKLYPNPKPTLKWNSPFEALIAVMLSAQCTDIVVNRITRDLFAIANTPGKIAALGQAKLAKIIKPCGLWRMKSKNIIATSQKLVNQEVPSTFKELTSLPGVGEKTAQVILTQIWGKPAFPVDTHIHRVANRLGICKTKTPTQTSACLKRKIPEQYWHNLHLQMIFHGRDTCMAREPKCEECALKEGCKYGGKK